MGHGAPTQTGHLCLVSGNTVLPSTPQMGPFHLPTSSSWRRVVIMDQPRPWKGGREGLVSSPFSRGCGLSPTLHLSIIAMGGVESHLHCLFWLKFERRLNPIVHSSALLTGTWLWGPAQGACTAGTLPSLHPSDAASPDCCTCVVSQWDPFLQLSCLGMVMVGMHRQLSRREEKAR